MAGPITVHGQCLCGGVRFETPDVTHIDACHCRTCQRWGGGPFIGADFRKGDVTITEDETLKWFASSEWAKRGFCAACGSNLFYRLNDNPEFWAVCAGALDIQPGMKLGKEIFIDEKPDYYTLSGEHPKMTGEAFLKSITDDFND